MLIPSRGHLNILAIPELKTGFMTTLTSKIYSLNSDKDLDLIELKTLLEVSEWISSINCYWSVHWTALQKHLKIHNSA